MSGIVKDRAWVDAMDHRGADVFFNALAQCANLQDRRAVDMFARDGVLTVARYFDKVKTLDLWEMNPAFKTALEQIPANEVIIRDSYQTVVHCPGKYDFIVVDTPQGVYDCTLGQVAEHFMFLPLLRKVMSDDCIVVVYVNKDPYVRDEVGNFGRDRYDTHDHEIWMGYRRSFYGSQVVEEGQAITTYKRLFDSMGFRTTKVLATPCWDDSPGLPASFRLALWLNRS